MMKIPQLNEHLINQLTSKYPGKVIVYDVINSTQTQAKQQWQAGPLPLTIVANRQTDGYGRHGRNFYSPADTGLYFSLVMPATTDILANVGLLTTGVAVVIGQQLHRLYPTADFRYKWVNDIYLNRKKVCGIITELERDTDRAAIIIGVGINLMTTAFPTALQTKADGISGSQAIDRNRLLAGILDAMTTFFAHYQEGLLLPEYRQKSLVLGQSVVVHCGHQTITGMATAIDNQGRLLVKDKQGKQHRVASGEVTKVNLQ